MINWQYYPKSDNVTTNLQSIIEVFKIHETTIDSRLKAEQSSNDVLAILRDNLINIDFDVESGKKHYEIINVPVLFGRNGVVEKSFKADAYNAKTRTVLEIESGRAVDNNQFLKDLFQACMMQNVDYLVIAVRNVYRNKPDFEKVLAFFDTLYASNRLNLPLKGVLIIGY